jgi:hypothetical protein
MSLPLSIQTRFDAEYDGFTAARFRSASEAHNMEASLREQKVSFQTKIIKNKKRGNEFVVMLVEKAV